MVLFSRFFLICLCSVYVSGCATNPVSGRPNLVFTSEEKEVRIGQQEHQNVLRQYTLYDDPALQEYVTGLVDELAANSHRSDLKFHSFVLDSPEVNAFALPGGYVYITRGIMAYMNSEAELAGVLGHEIGHVTARHGVRQQSAATVGGVLSTAASIVSGYRQIGEVANFASTALVRGYGRSHELEADRLGAEYLARTGYDPQEMINVVGILKDQEEFDKVRAAREGREPRAYHGLFATHPKNDRRLQEVIKEAEKFTDAAASRDAQGRFLQFTDGMDYGPSESQGILRGRNFYHKELDLALEFPANWRVSNQPTQLIAASPEQNALMRVTMAQATTSRSPQEFIEQNYGEIQNGRAIRGGEEGYTGFTRVDTPFGRQQIARISVIFKGSQAYQFLSVAQTTELLQQYDADMLTTASSVRGLKRDERTLATAQKLKLITVKPGDTFEKLAKNSPIKNDAADNLRLLNGLFPDGQPSVGQRIKIVE